MGEMLERAAEAGVEVVAVAVEMAVAVVVEEEADLPGPGVRRPRVAEATGGVVDVVVGGRKLLMVRSADLSLAGP